MKTIRIFPGILLGLLVFSHAAFGKSPLSVSEMVEQFEKNNRSWVYYEAEIDLDFYLAGGEKRTCGGKLFFQRLSEKFLLTCADAKNNPLFAFRAEDMLFGLHLPADGVLITGNIFDLEFSGEFESFVKPLAVYRALKPYMPSPSEVRAETRGENWVELIQEKIYHDKTYPARKLILTSEGTITDEMFLMPNGELTTRIRRKNFQALPWKKPSSIATAILIQSPKDKTQLVLTIKKILSTELPEDDVFLLKVPGETEMIEAQKTFADPKLNPGWSRSL